MAEPQKDHLPRIWIQPHYASFNGIRGLAIGMVFVEHFWTMLFPGYPVPPLRNGVELFFVLSGFLITGILYDSGAEERYFKNFYIRRALRIFPLYYGFFLLLVVLRPLLGLYWSSGFWTFPMYIGNLVAPFLSPTEGNPTVIGMDIHGHYHYIMNIGTFWSLCVEEQFYLIWPAVVWWIRDRRRLMQICVAGVVATLVIRIVLISFGKIEIIYWATYARADSLLIGGWLALWLRQHALSRASLRRLAAILFWPCAVLYVVNWHLNAPWWPSLVLTESLGYTVVAVAGAGYLLVSLDEESLVSRVMRNRALAALGVISYGVYIIHGTLIVMADTAIRRYPSSPWLVVAGVFAITVLIAELSFVFFESPFLSLKRRWAPQGTKKKAGADAMPQHLHVSEPQVTLPQ